MGNTTMPLNRFKHSGLWLKKVSKGSFILLGGSIIILAAMSYLTDKSAAALLVWAQIVFGWVFALIFSVLLGLGVLAIQKMRRSLRVDYWFEVGQQAANGISTLALTFTLLGISLGIGSLSEQTLSPDNIQSIIASLTQQFSTAFMTTVVGLPTASLLRACIGIQYQGLLYKEESKQ